ncbi:hypothetical protein PISMIDRAFT_680494 [Pisolithus microcarpus 441]|uniref:Uncharacterized protein n=1 Tax=Pisolithus microcarpus 441 TaxID=765257 RepID=A0A0C9ZR25_9AGAM|nr:hypothetical protein PISMIDRAFT_680494 [Pisolithus microcarpus 441]
MAARWGGTTEHKATKLRDVVAATYRKWENEELRETDHPISRYSQNARIPPFSTKNAISPEVMMQV